MKTLPTNCVFHVVNGLDLRAPGNTETAAHAARPGTDSDADLATHIRKNDLLTRISNVAKEKWFCKSRDEIFVYAPLKGRQTQ